MWPSVLQRHVANLAYLVEDLAGWERALRLELRLPRFANDAWVRVHDSGDFWSDTYTKSWMRIMRDSPHVQFYAYTKEVLRFKRIVEPDPPPNFRWVYSLGGKEDQELNPAVDRVADVFPTEAAIDSAGWHSQKADDRLAVLGPAPVGMSANNLKTQKRRQGDRTLGQWQASLQGKRSSARQSRQKEDACLSRPTESLTQPEGDN
jgi:hypothetical protein